jgi:acyl-coenzyme A synthetase/AMP-(fatty) acid ligase
VVDGRPNPERIAEMIAAEQVTALWAGSPAMVRALDAVLTARPDLDAHRCSSTSCASSTPATTATSTRKTEPF